MSLISWFQVAVAVIQSLPALITDIQNLITKLHPVAQPAAREALKAAIRSGSSLAVAAVHKDICEGVGCAAVPVGT